MTLVAKYQSASRSNIGLTFFCFFSYGGPGSQMTDLKFNRDWDHYVACGLQYIVVVVDGRGTGYKGRKLMNPVRNNLGFFETRDQINAAKSVGVSVKSRYNHLLAAQCRRIWAAKNYVDPKRIGIWGWVRIGIGTHCNILILEISRTAGS